MSVHWRLAQAIAWIAERTEEAVVDAPEQVVIIELAYAHEWNGTKARAARAKLWEALEAGKITATGIAPDGERHTIPKERWRDLKPTLHGKTEPLQRPGFHPGTIYTDVIVASAAVRKKWPAVPPKGKRGPKPKVDRAAFRAEVMRWVVKYGFPNPKLDPASRQSDLERHMMVHFREALSEGHNRKLVSEVLREIEADNSRN